MVLECTAIKSDVVIFLANKAARAIAVMEIFWCNWFHMEFSVLGMCCIHMNTSKFKHAKCPIKVNTPPLLFPEVT